MPAPNLYTKRLILRKWENEDLLIFANMNKDLRVMEFFPSVLSEKESNLIAQKIIKELQEKEYGLWAVELKETSSFIGFVGLHQVDFVAPFTPCIEIAWRIAFDYWRKGYAYEAASKVIDYAFDILKLKEIVSFTTVSNIRSRKLMEKLKMTHDKKDDFDHPKLSKNHPLHKHVLYRLKNPNIK